MKYFSDFEKNFITTVIELHNSPSALVVLGNLIEEYIPSSVYLELQSEGVCFIMVEKRAFNEFANKFSNLGISAFIKEIREKLISILRLLEYLEKKKYIYLSDSFQIEAIGDIKTDEPYIQYEIKDNNISRLLYKYSHFILVPSFTLIQFVKNKFLTDIQKRTFREYELDRKTIRVAAFGVIVAIASLIVSIIFNIIQMNKNDIIKVKIVNNPIPVKIMQDSLIKASNNQIDYKDTMQIESKNSFHLNKK